MRGLVGGLARTPRDLVGGLAAGPGKGLSGHWLGMNRWVVPGENPETHSGILLTAQLEKGNSGRVEKLVAQGRRVPMERPLHGPTAGLLANQLERTAMCVGECLPDQVQTALGDDELKHQVTELDPAAFEWNCGVLGGRAFQVAGTASNRWRAGYHAASETASQTVRATTCTGVVVAPAAGEHFQPNCDACHALKGPLKGKLHRKRKAEAEDADPELAAAKAERRAGPGINTRFLTPDEVQAKELRRQRDLKNAKRREHRAKLAITLREEDGFDPGEDMEEDVRAIMRDPKAKAAAQKEFGVAEGEEESMSALMWQDHEKYNVLEGNGKETGMRWHPKVYPSHLSGPPTR